mmetsp:Transcript_23204/g.66477  ORF Transcript_23204/g.66477 Transcript_23204/m.66477 type:complete len:98 (-) Transcript_23204:1777-2070(-)
MFVCLSVCPSVCLAACVREVDKVENAVCASVSVRMERGEDWTGCLPACRFLPCDYRLAVRCGAVQWRARGSCDGQTDILTDGHSALEGTEATCLLID